MSTQRVNAFVDDELTLPGHTALVAYNHSTRARSLSCDDCAEHLGRFLPDRWLAKHIREAWEKHIDAWCRGIGVATLGPDGRYVAAKCGATGKHAGHWLDGRDYVDTASTRKA
jgi:hypothetical protein